ncbi:glutamine amidotransferase of anthranilate synthase or aminodeoxychorismate synthase [Thiovulum sp. ES]|nr:glutamine amidotransferase of anthranilate synthase or aminodeoxychorismate synthase [Thiovulum sp. ES]
MILMIDNYDSFTYNIVQYCNELGADLKVVRNDEVSVEQIREMNPEKIIISPGPASPNEAGISLDVVDKLGKAEIPILGICLGHQTIAQVFGGEIVEAKNMMHGKTSQIQLFGENEIFNGIPKEFRATRYHSLVVNRDNLSEDIEPLAWSADDKELMAMKVKNLPIYGIQFHPESIMSEFGHEMLDNFLKLKN